MKRNYYEVFLKQIFSKFAMLLLLGLMLSTYASAQDFAINFGRTTSGANVAIDNMQQLRVTYTYPGLLTFGVKSEQGVFNELSMPDAYWIGELGTPKLPASKDLIEIPFGAEVVVKVRNYTMSEYKLSDYGIDNLVMPVQPSIRKDQNVDEVPFEYRREVYQQDAFIGHELASVEVLGVLRSARIARLTIAPVSYNPVQGIIRVYNDIDIEINFVNADISQTQYIKESTHSPYFDVIYKSLLNSPGRDYPLHPDLTKYPVKYLIVSHRMFENDLQPFIEWKTKKGFKVIVAYTDVIGTSYSAIQSYIHGQYNAGTPTDPAPSFVLLVGDTPQLPSSTGSSSGKMTDLYYASVDGDYFPEMYYGRFSATNSAQLVTQINKTLYHEKYEFEDPSYLNKATIIAGADGTWNPRIGQPTVQYAITNYWNAAHGYTDVYAYLTSPYTGCYTPEKIAVSFINYSAHCNETSWGDPVLSQSAVNAFTNVNKYPLAIGNCCLAADFGYSECMGETWQRGVNKGSVAYIGSAPNSYWFEDFYWAVGAFPLQGTNNGYVPTYDETTWGGYDAPWMSDYVTTGGIVFVGNLAVTEVHIQSYPSHSSPLYYWQAYNVLGDPSLVAYNTEGSTNTVSHMPILPIGLNTYEVTALPGSYVGISKDGVLHGAGLVDATGTIMLTIDPVLSSGMVDIVVTKPQHVPYMVQVPAAALVGPYVVLDSYTIHDASGNNNGLADYGENIGLNVTLKNVGADPSAEVVATITGSDPYFTLTSAASTSFGVIANDATATVNNAYTFSIADYVPDQHKATFVLEITDGTDNWTSNLHITVQAPELTIANNLTINDTQGGNGNGQADPGETVDLIIATTNAGHSQAVNLTGVITSSSPYVTINVGQISFTTLDPDQTSNAVFTVTISEDAPIGTPVLFNYTISSGDYIASKEFIVKVGLIIEDFETGDFSSFTWMSGGNLPWTIISTGAFEGTYAAKSGAITHNQSSQLILEYDVGANDSISFYRKVSSENNYDFLKFYINNTVVAQWSGNQEWSRVAFPVTQGFKVFKWEYMKDVSVSSGSDCAWIDYIIFPTPAVCPSPRNLQVVSTSSNSALLTWTPGGSEAEWDLIWGPKGFNPSTSGTLITNITEVPYLLTGLQAITQYDFYVRGYCDATTLSAWNGPVTLQTQCDTFTLPFTEAFGGPSVNCWTYPDGQGNWNIGTQYTPPSGSAPNAFFGWSPSITNYDYSMVSPLFSAVGFTDIKLDFKLYINNYSTSTLEQMTVEYKTFESTEWLLVENFTNSGGTASFNRTNLPLDGVAGQLFQVRFRAHGGNSYNINGWGLDDVVVHGTEAPSVLPGDANCDGIVNILDAIAIVNFIAGYDPQPFCFENADVTEDGIINVLDVIGTVNIIINGKKSSGFEIKSAPANIYMSDTTIELESDGTLAGLQFEISGLNTEDISLLMKDYEFMTTMKNGKLMGMIFSFDNTPIPAGKINLLSINNESKKAEWGSVIAGNLNAEEVRVIKYLAGSKDVFAGEFQLNAYPNPSNGATTISASAPVSSWVSIKIFDMHGKEVTVVTENVFERGIQHFVTNEGRALKSGIYNIQLIASPIDMPGEVYRKNLKLVIN